MYWLLGLWAWLHGHANNGLKYRQQYATSLTHILKCIFMNEKFCDLIKISLKFVPKVAINNIPALV